MTTNPIARIPTYSRDPRSGRGFSRYVDAKTKKRIRQWFPGVDLHATIVCDNNPDEIDGEFIDGGGNTLCICIADFTGDGFVSGADLGILLSSWGPCVSGAPCLADLTGDGFVTGADLGLLLGAWGVCP